MASVEITDADASGVLFAHGSRFGGHTLFLKDKKLHYVYNFLGIDPEQVFVSDELDVGKYTLGMEFTRKSTGKNGEHLGSTKLYVNDKVVDSGDMRAQPDKFTLSGEGLCIGYDSGDAVTSMYQTLGTFTGGTIHSVTVDTDKDCYEDLELEANSFFLSTSVRNACPCACQVRRRGNTLLVDEGLLKLLRERSTAAIGKPR